MDSPRERFLATVLGALATAFGVLAVEIVPDLLLYPSLMVDWSGLAATLGLSLVVGAAGGFFGHIAFLHFALKRILVRAVTVGVAVGLVVGVAAWLIAYLLPEIFLPFSGADDADGFMRRVVLPHALVAGPGFGVLIAVLVSFHLRKVTGEREPLPKLQSRP